MQNDVALAMLIELGAPAQGSGAVEPWAGTALLRRWKTSKNLKMEHIYFSDSNYFVWKTVNTITLTTELRGFEDLTHCFPSRQAGRAGGQRLLRIAAQGLQTQVAHLVSSQK